MIVSVNFSSFVLRCSAAVAILFAFSGCDRNAAEVTALRAENDRLKAELAQLRRKPNSPKETESQPGKPDLILDINELWSQRFEDNDFRAKQRLAGKTIRVTGPVDSVSGEAISLYGVGRVSRNVRLSVNLESAYAAKIQDGLAALERGATVTVQGRFAFDRMGLDDSTFVNKATGNTLSAEEMLALAQTSPDNAVSQPVPEKR